MPLSSSARQRSGNSYSSSNTSQSSQSTTQATTPRRSAPSSSSSSSSSTSSSSTTTTTSTTTGNGTAGDPLGRELPPPPNYTPSLFRPPVASPRSPDHHHHHHPSHHPSHQTPPPTTTTTTTSSSFHAVNNGPDTPSSATIPGHADLVRKCREILEEPADEFKNFLFANQNQKDRDAAKIPQLVALFHEAVRRMNNYQSALTIAEEKAASARATVALLSEKTKGMTVEHARTEASLKARIDELDRLSGLYETVKAQNSELVDALRANKRETRMGNAEEAELRNQIDELQRKLSDAEKQNDSMLRKCKSHEAHVRDLSQLLDDSNRELSRVTDAWATQESDRMAVESAFLDKSRECDTLYNKLQVMQTQYEETQQVVQQLSTQMDILNRRNKTAASHDAVLADTIAELEAHSQMLSGLEQEKVSLKESLKDAFTLIEREQRDKDEAQRLLMNAQAENKVLQEKVETLASQFRVLSERMRGIESSGRNIEAQADAQRAKNGVLEEQLRDERRRWEEERQRRVEAEMRCEKAEQAWHEFEVKVGYMQKQVEDAMRDRQRTTEALRIKEREVEECVRMLAEMNNHK